MIRIRLKAFDHGVLDQSTAKIVQTVERYEREGGRGPCPFPPRSTVTQARSGTPQHKDSREHFEMRVHKRLLDIVDHTAKTGRLAPAPRPSGGRGTSRSDSPSLTAPDPRAFARARPVVYG